MTEHLIINDDCCNINTDDKKVHLIVTSPPYWNIKNYDNPNQIGYGQSYEEYIKSLNSVWSLCNDILHDGCRMCINIGDQFVRATKKESYKILPIRTEIIKHCMSIGMDYMGAIIWQKMTNMKTSGGACIMGSYPFPRNGIVKLNYEFILLFKKKGKPPLISKEQKELSKMTKEEWNEYFQSHWTFSGTRQKEHIAMFPEELPKRLIKMFSFVDETVFDPFLGSGTTSIVASKLDRNSIGYELNKDYIEVIKNKVNDSKNKTLFENKKENNFIFK